MPIPLVYTWLDLLGVTFPQVRYPNSSLDNTVTGRIAQTAGSNVYAFTIPTVDGAGFPVPGPLLARKSTNGGATWSTPTQTSPFDASIRTGISPAVRSPIRDAFTAADGKVYIPWFNVNQFEGQPDPIEPFMLAAWNPGADSWGTAQTFAFPSGMLGAQLDGVRVSALCWCRIRPDGSIILIFNRNVIEDDGRCRVEIYEDAGGGFSSIGSVDLGSGIGSVGLYGNQMAADGTIHSFLLGTSDFGDTYRLYHASLSTSNNVSALHLIETIETNGWGPPIYPLWHEPALSVAEVAFGYPFQLQGVGDESPNELRVVRGDLTGDPLNPTFTVDTVSSTILPAIGNYDRSSLGIKCFYDGAVLNVAYTSDYGVIRPDGLPYNQLWIAQRASGTWGAPQLAFAPPVFPPGPFFPTNYTILYYDVYPLAGGGFTGTVDIGYGDNNYGVGYAAKATTGRFTFSHTGRGSPYRRNRPGSAGARSRSVKAS